MAYIGKTPSQAVRSRYFYTAAGGETSLSGADDNGDTLIFADGNYVDVYLNGVLLVASSDYNVNTVNTIAGLTALTASDIVEIVVYDTFSVFGGVFQGDLSADTITGDMFGSHQFEAKNIEGSTIPKGTPVYIAGHSGNDPEIAIADADDPAKMPAFGITTAAIANNNKGNVIVFGNYIGIDTSGFSVGDELYVSNTGTLVNTRPTASADKVQKIAKVIRSQSQNGQIFVMGAGRSNDVPNAIATNSINLSSTTTVSSVLDEDAMTSDSATALATQQSIKAYVDSQIGSNNELSEILTNGNTTGGNDISFGDNDKAIFGAGSDLQIYHDSTAGNSYIDDAGTGWLYLRADERVLIASQSTGNISAKFFTNAQAELAHNNSTKLATTATGVDVTGTVAADGLDATGDVDTWVAKIYNTGSDANAQGLLVRSDATAAHDALALGVYADSGYKFVVKSSGNVGIGTTSPQAGYKLHVNGAIQAENESFSAGRENASKPSFNFHDDTDTGIFNINPNILGFSTSGSERLRITSGGDLIKVGGVIKGERGTAAAPAYTFSDDTDTGMFNISNADLGFAVGGSERMRINSSGAVGVNGATNPTSPLSVGGNSTQTLKPTVNILDEAAGASLSLRGGSPRIFMDSMAGGVPKILMDGQGIEFKDGTLDSEGNVDLKIDSSGNLLCSTGDIYLNSLSTGSSTYLAYSGGNPILMNTVNGALRFGTNNTERMRITSSGDLLVGKTASSATSVGFEVTSSSGVYIRRNNNARIIQTTSYDTSAQFHHVFANNSGTTVGNILVNTTSTAYNTSSDYRLKENVVADWDATTRLKQLNPVRFNFIADADITVDGFLAHEVQGVVPEAISGTKDAMMDEEYEVTPAVLDDDGNEVTPAVMGTRSVPDYQGIDQSKLVPLLVKTIQELEARITALETA